MRHSSRFNLEQPDNTMCDTQDDLVCFAECIGVALVFFCLGNRVKPLAPALLTRTLLGLYHSVMQQPVCLSLVLHTACKKCDIPLRILYVTRIPPWDTQDASITSQHVPAWAHVNLLIQTAALQEHA